MSERLTERDEYGNADIIGIDSSELQGSLEFDELNLVTNALNKLADYEDAEREGRVVVLPVKQGTRFYAANQKHGRIIERDFDKFELTLMDEKGWGVVAFENGESTPIFSTRAEAERALATTKPKGDAT